MKHFAFLFLMLSTILHAFESNNPIESGYDEGFYVQTADRAYSLKINLKSQFGLTSNWTNGSSSYQSFDLHQGKLITSGNLLHPKFNFYIQSAFASNSRQDYAQTLFPTSPDGSFYLEDAHFMITFLTFELHFGQMKVPTLKEWNKFFDQLKFLNRTLSTQAFHLGRDRGLYGRFNLSKLNLLFGIMNGDPALKISGVQELNQNQSNSSDPSSGFLYFSKLSYKIFHSRENLEDRRLLEFAASFSFDHHRPIDTTLDLRPEFFQSNILQSSFDFTWLSKHFFLEGEFVYQSTDFQNLEKFKRFGFYSQLSAPLSKQLELATSYSFLNQTFFRADKEHEMKASLNFHINRQTKVQLQHRWLKQERQSQQSDLAFTFVL